MDILAIKYELINIGIMYLENRIRFLECNIQNAQAEANQHKGAMQSRYDTFKEEAQYLKGGFERQLQDAINDMAIIKSITVQKCSKVQLGSIIQTDEIGCEINSATYFFVSFGIPPELSIINNVPYTCLKYSTPFITTIKNSLPGDSVKFRGRDIEILDIF